MVYMYKNDVRSLYKSMALCRTLHFLHSLLLLTLPKSTHRFSWSVRKKNPERIYMGPDQGVWGEKEEECRGGKMKNLGQHRTIWQAHSAKDFASYESYKRAGILYVFPPFITARMGQKIGRRPQTQLCGDALEKRRLRRRGCTVIWS